jgi:hypothetical protein
MPKFRTKAEGHTFRRKNAYMPCIISARVEQMSEAEYAQMMKETGWADLITNAEWPVVLGHVGATKTNRSRLKKIAWWLMALGRIAALNPDLFDQAAREARDLYAAQIEGRHPLMFHLDGEYPGWYLAHRIEADPVPEGPQPAGDTP